MNNPAELPNPEDTGLGSIGRIPFPKEMPQELTPFVARSLLSEILGVRNRLHAIENAAIIARFRGVRGILGEINELEMDPGGGGGGFPPHEIHEIQEIQEIAELRPFSAVEALIDVRIESLRSDLTNQIEQLSRQIQDKLG